MKHSELPKNHWVEPKHGSIYVPARTIQNIRGAACGFVPKGTEFLVHFAIPLYDRWHKGEQEYKLIDRSQEWNHALCRNLGNVGSVYHYEYEILLDKPENDGNVDSRLE